MRATDSVMHFVNQQSTAIPTRTTAFGKPPMLAKNRMTRTFCTSDKMTTLMAISALSYASKGVL